MSIELPRSHLEHIAGAPLKRAIAQVRFPPIYEIEKRERVADFQKLLGDRYEATEPQRTQTLTVHLGGAGLAPASPIPEPETIWPFQSDNRNWMVALSSTSLALESTDYLDFDDFSTELRAVLGAVCEAFRPSRQTRLGVRYINEIEDGGIAQHKFLDFFRPELLSPVGSELGTDIARSLSELHFRQPDGILVLRHGLVAEATYLLDFDYFNEDDRAFEQDQVVERVVAYHDVIERLFVWSLNERYLERLKAGGR